MENFLTYAPLVIVLYGIIHYTVREMKKLGTIFVLVIYAKWLFGVLTTFFAFYIIYLSGTFLKENGLTTLISLPIGIFVWFEPMHYSSKLFESLEEKYKKETE